jgi:phosphate transport system permease protein
MSHFQLIAAFSISASIFSGVLTQFRYMCWTKKGHTIAGQKKHFFLFNMITSSALTIFISSNLILLVEFSPLLDHPYIGLSLISVIGILSGHTFLSYKSPARIYLEFMGKAVLLLATLMTSLVTLGVVLSIIFESIKFFNVVPLTEFIFGTQWSPQASTDDVRGHFGTLPLFMGSILITCIALLVAGPIGLYSAVFTAFYAPPRIRHLLKPILEMLAGIPTVVYGFFAIVFVAPFVRKLGLILGIDIATESAIVAGLVMGVMIIPFISSLTDDVLYAQPQALRDGSLGLGATYEETIRLVLLPSAFPGIASAFLLAISRAIGETMLVVMAAGMSANLTLNPLQPVTTVTVQIVCLLTGDQEFKSPKTLAAFALGLTLFAFTFLLNLIAFRIVQNRRAKYESH